MNEAEQKALRDAVFEQVVYPEYVERNVNLCGVTLYMDRAGCGGHLRLTYNGEKQRTRIWQPYMSVVRWVDEVCLFVVTLSEYGDAPTSWESYEEWKAKQEKVDN